MSSSLNTEKFGVHILFDGYSCDSTLLSNFEHLKNILLAIPEQMVMNTISEPVVVEVGPQNHRDPGGISGFVMIAESHISFHTFPKKGFVTADIYTCQNDIDSEKFITLFAAAFGTSDYDTQVIERGLRYPTEDINS